MKSKRVAAGVLVIAVVIATIAMLPQRFVMWEHVTHSQLLTSEDDVYLYINVRVTGWHGNRFGYAWQMFRNWVGTNTSMKEGREDLIVLHYAGDNWRNMVVRNVRPSRVFAVNDTLYAKVDGVLSRWSGYDFEPLDGLEARRVLGAAQLSDGKGSSWINHMNVLAFGRRETTYPLSVRGHSLELVIANDFQLLQHVVAERAGNGATRELWSSNSRPRIVEEQTYRRLFRREQM